MLAFFATVGLGTNLSLVKTGGKLLIVYWGLVGFIFVFQNFIGIFVAKLTNINPLIGMMCGAISMQGGHGEPVSRYLIRKYKLKPVQELDECDEQNSSGYEVALAGEYNYKSYKYNQYALR